VAQSSVCSMTDTPDELPALGHTSSERPTSAPTVRSACPNAARQSGGCHLLAREKPDFKFHHRDHPGVLVTYCYDATTDPDNPTTITVQREIEYLVCTDPADPGGSELWSAYRTTAVPGRYASVQAVTDAALEAAQAHLVCEEPWSGRSPWTPEHQEEPR
jgi:hypothetical protein